jgi:cyclophilin family peptidyl-prolyl cis-trans isomerase
MWPLPIAAVLTLLVSVTLSAAADAQTSTAPLTRHAVLAAEYARDEGLPVLRAALASPDTALQRIAARGLGRLERAEHVALLQPLFTSPAVAVRREAVNAAAQMKDVSMLPALLRSEQDASVRAAIYESWGRAVAPSAEVQTQLVTALGEPSVVARRGAARGMEAYLRRTARTARATEATVQALRTFVADNTDSESRLLALLALTAAGDRDSVTVQVALRDTSAEVRRAAVALGRVWRVDAAPMVRWQALRVAGNCERAASLVNDASEHVALLALDVLGEKSCDAALLRPWLAPSVHWRKRAHAMVAIAKISPDDAATAVKAMAVSPVWQARAWAALGAKAIDDKATLRTLARDSAPNVMIAAMTTPADALRALSSNHAGVLLQAATLLRTQKEVSVPLLRSGLLSAFARISRTHGATFRDPRVALLQTLVPLIEPVNAVFLRSLLKDKDPAVAAIAADGLKKLGSTGDAAPRTRYVPAPFPSAAELAAMDGASATMRIKGKGTVSLRLLPDDATMATYTFMRLAEAKRYDGLTFHRIVPNFVIQGGSPGADEYDPVTDTFMRDEVGFARNARGTFGISTRGRDTGDGQIYVNLINNVRLDHDYTVFAETVRGLDVVDAVQEGDVIESITIRRAARARAIRR